MANVDEDIPLTLPDTQVATQPSQRETAGLSSSPSIWGRLIPSVPQFSQLVMSKDSYTIGRQADCDVQLTRMHLDNNHLGIISKVHFRISRETSHLAADDGIVYLSDFSSNGTFVNGLRVGKGNRVVLRNNDSVALAKPNLEVYTYLSSSNPESDRLPPVLRSKYVVSRTLGSGACGEVKLILGITGGKKFALKTITKRSATARDLAKNALDAERIRTEVGILTSLRHPCIIKMEEIVDTPANMYIVLEMMEGGELFDRIVQADGLTESVAKLIFYQIVLAVHYLHSRGITHRDLKPENILLASDAEYPLVKVTDFGLSKFVDEETMMQTFCGTPMYVAPEMVLTNGRGTYTKQVDVWSLGVILYVSLTGRTPFNIRNTNVPLRDQIVKGMYRCSPALFGDVSPRAIDLIKRMMTPDPIKRIDIQHVLLHPWLQDRTMRHRVDQLISSYEENSAPPSDNRLDEPMGDPFPKRTRCR